ncbi:MAG TPA: hypothetical protein VD794_04040, partial [Flavisolibacter sp.]|nr:hypothetical protein [Flavisolibacter sp.]
MGRILTILLFLITTLSSTGQEYIFNRLSVSDGLASNFIHSVWQDEKGFIWIGTENGLQRYDGQRFVHYGKRIKETFLTQPIEQVLGDNNGNIWLRSGTRIALLDPDKFTLTAVPIAQSISVMPNGAHILQKNAKGDVFLLIRGHGWLFYNPSKKMFDEERSPFKIPTEFRVHLVYEDVKTGNYWIGGTDGIGLFDNKTKQLFTKHSKFIKHPILKEERLGKHVTNFFIDDQRRLWIVNWDLGEGKSNGQQFYCFDEKLKRFTNDTTGLSQVSKRGYFQLNEFNQLHDKTLLVYGLKSFALYNTNTRAFESVYHPEPAYYSIKFNSINGLIQDKEDLLWIATDNGLYTSQMKSKESRHIQKDEGAGVINALLEHNDQEIWVGTWGEGLTIYDKLLHKKETPSYLRLNKSQTPYFMVWDLMKHEKTGDIWIGCQGGRLMISNPNLQKSTFLVPKALENKTIRQIKQDKYGNCWLGSHKGHVVKWTAGLSYDDSRFKSITNLQFAINKMLIDTHDRLWVATDGGGIYVIDIKKEKVIQHINVLSHNLPDNRVSEIIQFNDSLYFLGSASLSLYNFNLGKLKNLDQGQDNVPHTIFAMQLTDDKQLWISTMAGIYKYNPEKEIYTFYNQWDGLISA